MLTRKGIVLSDANKDFITKLIIIVLFGLVLLFLYHILTIIVIFLFALLFNILFSPLLNSLNKRKIGDPLGMVLIYIVLIVLIVLFFLLIIPIFVNQILLLIDYLKNWLNSFTSAYEAGGIEGLGIPSFLYPLIQNIDIEQVLTVLNNNMSQISTFFAKNLNSILSSGVGIVSSITSSIFTFILVFVFTFFIALERKQMREVFYMILPTKVSAYLLQKEKPIIQVLSSWIKGQLILGGSIFIVTLIGLFIVSLFGVNLESKLTLALIAGLMEFIPYIGPFIAVLPAIALAMALGYKAVLVIIILYIVIQQIENNLLVPYVMSRQLKLSPFLILIGMMIGATLFGIIGIIIVIPVISIVQIFWNDYFGNKS